MTSATASASSAGGILRPSWKLKPLSSGMDQSSGEPVAR